MLARGLGAHGQGQIMEKSLSLNSQGEWDTYRAGSYNFSRTSMTPSVT